MSWEDLEQARLARIASEEAAAAEGTATGFEEPELARPGTAEDKARARKDAEVLGIGFLVDGIRIDPNRVVMLRGAHYPHVTTSELWNSLEGVLREKGASDAWLEYVMGDLQVAATQYGASCWGEGHKAGASGQPMPNPQDAYTPGVEPMPEPIDTDQIPWNQPGSTQQSLGAALAEHGTGGDTYD